MRMIRTSLVLDEKLPAEATRLSGERTDAKTVGRVVVQDDRDRDYSALARVSSLAERNLAA